MEKIIAEELWTVYYDYENGEWILQRLDENDTKDGFYVNDDGDLFMRPKMTDARMMFIQQAWFRKREHAQNYLREQTDG